MNTDLIHLSHIAECLLELCERLDLLGHSFSSFPGGFGAYGVMCDATPSRKWALLLDPEGFKGKVAVTREQIDDLNHWWRIISVLCSRLYMAKVSDLPGYDHDAKEGPFGGTT